MITSLFIANRGEIAVRIIRTCREMGIRTVAAYSRADEESLPVEMADAAVCVGPPASKDSYTHMGNLISAALYAGCDAIHPGVGFLSENAEFASSVKKAGLVFIGPDPRTITFMGNKVQAKKTAVEATLQLIPGSDGSKEELVAAKGFADEVGYPVIIKAASGGGGKGMRIVRDEDSLEKNMKIAAHEAQTAFSDGTIYMEKYLENPRHVEVQILADTHGNVIHLGERDCSLQRKHQKLVEESPSPGMNQRLRDRMCRDAVNLFAKLDYKGAGTVEFLFDGEQYFFMEVNARVQVEHPVSEYVSGIDIIREQIRACSGESLKLSQEEIRLEGASIECRINALSPGTVREYFQPGGRNVRFDSFLYQGYRVQPYYDALLGKLITYGSTRRSAVERMVRALAELKIDGISTNIEEQKRIIDSAVFRKGVFGTYDLPKILEE